MLEVKTLGCFQLFLDGRPVTLGRQSGNNIEKLFVILVLQGSQGIARRELIRQLFYRQGAEFDTGANLRITVYRLRQALKKALVPQPEGEDYILMENGNYRWNPAIPVSVDVTEFMELAARAEEEEDREKSLKLGEEAFSLYGGEFLSEFSSEEWVNTRQIELGKIYRKLFLHQYQLLYTGGGIYRHSSWQNLPPRSIPLRSISSI